MLHRPHRLPPNRRASSRAVAIPRRRMSFLLVPVVAASCKPSLLLCAGATESATADVDLDVGSSSVPADVVVDSHSTSSPPSGPLPDAIPLTEDDAASSSDSSSPSSSSTDDAASPAVTAQQQQEQLTTQVQTLQSSLDGCTSQLTATKDGFQNLYSQFLETKTDLTRCQRSSGSANTTTKDGAADASSLTPEEEEHYRTKIESLETKLDKLETREGAWERTIHELIETKKKLEMREGAWERSITELLREVEKRNGREEGLRRMVSQMEEFIQWRSRREVLERFGPGPHRVSFELEFPSDDASASDSLSPEQIVFELAPLDYMPHTIHLFLSQVAAGSWDGGGFLINAGHILQACPPPCLDDDGDDEDLYQSLRESHLDSVSFQEYHPSYPHLQYTIGLAGRPMGGPEFYINLLDNSDDHGPGGQRPDFEDDELESLDDEVADPCFGKLVGGQDVVEKLIAIPTVPEEDEEAIGVLLRTPVGIAHAKILPRGESSDALDSDNVPAEDKDSTSVAASAEDGSDADRGADLPADETKEEL